MAGAAPASDAASVYFIIGRTFDTTLIRISGAGDAMLCRFRYLRCAAGLLHPTDTYAFER